MTKIAFVLWIFALLLKPDLSFCGQESKGGSPLKDRFKRIGHFLIYHLENNQVRLSTRLSDFKKFKDTVVQVPIQLVDDFPDLPNQLKEKLVAMTVDDPKSPIGKTILLHHRRFEKALDEFDGGKEVVITISTSDLRRTIRQTIKVTEEEENRYLKEISFLSFCFHEFLLAAGEKDKNTELSSFLSAKYEHFDKWQKQFGFLIDNTLEVYLPYFQGTGVEAKPEVGGTSWLDDVKEEALQKFSEDYEKNGKDIEEKRVKSIRDSFSKKIKVVKIRKEGEIFPTFIQLSFRYGEKRYRQYGSSYSWQPPIGGYYRMQKKLLIYLDSDQKPESVNVERRIKGKPATYKEFENSQYLFDKKSVISAHEKAYRSFLHSWEKNSAVLEKTYRQIYGDSFLFLDMGVVGWEIEPADLSEPTINFREYGQTIQWHPTWAIYYYCQPKVYFLRQE